VKWSQRSDPNNPNSVKFSKMESFLEMGGFPSIEPFTMYGSPVSLFLARLYSMIPCKTAKVELMKL
jgi:hypothetical protein